MENEQNFSGQSPEKKEKLSKNTIVLICITAVLALVLVGLLITIQILHNMMQPIEEPSTEPSITTEPEPSTTESLPPDETVKEWIMMEHMAELYAQNPEIVGWVKIEDTKIDYPVMHTPENEDKYSRKNFEQKTDTAGLPMLDKDCVLDRENETKNLIIYAHNMGNGTAFGQLKKYAKKDFWEEHPYISFSSLYEERTYEVVAAFYDRIYYNYEQVFKFYFFVDPQSAEEYEEANAEYHRKAEYDTGIDLKDGDRLITLVTCAYHTEDGRFVVVAREVTPEEMAEREAQAQAQE